MLYIIFEKIRRRSQASVLRNHPRVSLKDLRSGTDNHFILDPGLEQVSLGHRASFRNYIHILVGKKARLDIGDDFFMNNFCSINCLESISIGNHTLFGENVKLYDHNHAYETTPEFRISYSDFSTAPIRIGNNCWLGSNVTVLKGVTIGDNCIIGAGCTVYRDIPANTTVVNRQELILNTRA